MKWYIDGISASSYLVLPQVAVNLGNCFDNPATIASLLSLSKKVATVAATFSEST